MFCRMLILTSIIFLTFTIAFSQGTSTDFGGRDAFLVTRPNTRAKDGSTNKSYTYKQKIKGSPLVSAIGLGYTVYLRNEDNEGVVIDPAHKFKTGDAVRFTFETNMTGYLYIFETVNNGDPELIYPDPRINDGNNLIKAHVPFDLPSSQNPNPARQWLTFDGEPSIDRLYIVISRNPIAGIPSSMMLWNYLQKNKRPWSPSKSTWAYIKDQINSHYSISRLNNYGEIQSQLELDSIGRHLGVSEDALQPSVVVMSSIPKNSTFVALIELVHE